MPLYDFVGQQSGRTVERWFPTFRNVVNQFIEDGELYVRRPSAPGLARMADSGLHGAVKRLEQTGRVPWEPGMDRDVESARRAREATAEAERHAAIEKTLTQF